MFLSAFTVRTRILTGIPKKHGDKLTKIYVLMSNIILEIKWSDYLSLFRKTTIEKQNQLIFLFEYSNQRNDL